MADQLLNVSALSAGTEDKPILHGVDLAVGAGECHVLMGPNGAGKSTLGHVIMGDPAYAVTGGSITFDGADVTELTSDKRSLAGIFLSYQAPVADQLELDQSFLMRELNVGFSGGEKKKIEMLQLLLLQPKLAILDETDSGLDVDALGIVSRGIQAYREQVGGALIVITHNTRILERLSVDRTHVMVHGHMVAEGDASLIADIDANGFERFERALGERDEACVDCPGCPKAGDAE